MEAVEESLKCVAAMAYAKFELRLEGLWRKKGKSRTVTIRTRALVTASNHALRIAGDTLPVQLVVHTFRSRRELINVCAELGLSHGHGLRQAKAQDTYSMLVGYAYALADSPL